MPALTDLVYADGFSGLAQSNPHCPEGRQLCKHGYARWEGSSGAGRWVVTPDGWTALASLMHPTHPEAA